MFKQTLILLTLLAPGLASASIHDDIARIRPLLPAGSDVAQIQASLLRGASPEQAVEAGERNYLLRDLNGDGAEDLLVISEEQPRYENYETNAPCSAGEPDCWMVYGKRALHFFVGDANGNLSHVFTNNSYVRGADEGGVFGDPLNGISVRKSGAIEISFYGGSAWRWSFDDVVQFRRGHLYVIGQDSYSGWTIDLRSDTKSVNYLTGEVVETHQAHADAPVRTKRYRVKVKPLVKLADYTEQN